MRTSSTSITVNRPSTALILFDILMAIFSVVAESSARASTCSMSDSHVYLSFGVADGFRSSALFPSFEKKVSAVICCSDGASFSLIDQHGPCDEDSIPLEM